MIRLLVARHGNTFAKGQTPTRVGARTDIPLVDSGQEQARRMGKYLRAHQMVPDQVFASSLTRTQETARYALEEMDVDRPIQVDEMFNEIDYGPDENQTEEDVVNRLGANAIDAWNKKAVVPTGWKVDPSQIIANWIGFGTFCEREYPNQTILVVTSNGIARFSPYLTGDFDAFSKEYPLKIATGALCLFEKTQNRWQVTAWNFKP